MLPTKSMLGQRSSAKSQMIATRRRRDRVDGATAVSPAELVEAAITLLRAEREATGHEPDSSGIAPRT